MSFDSIWEEVFSNLALGKYPGEDLIRFVTHNFYRTPQRSAVEILKMGCGLGANLWFISLVVKECIVIGEKW